ncbi:divalent-cation tolerance protein CutA [Caminibacter pacificus]|uniref:Divalent-cation tolerance protein CutA n=1 Tax=Caminibacter pacificus TaxID=1424653 RepID=A0AAJ4RE77_9BACT|nr:divalent-cation tolerance protein CutA [Caminibacter pacificus]NPA88294.1 divalent-cation tolerance protein CutA [Campylobacterota bacterium]QCI28305.1 divalent-cation tolerance protein CutA [Caminibacter pacificus]ROR40981.1 periplasmic divalent cation tolerance protein [Caminibacter pacificus]
MFIVVYCTIPKDDAKTLANLLVKNSLAACVNIIDEVNSVFLWQGEIKEEKESLLIIKTKQDVFKQLEIFITKNHPYDVPEIIALPIVNANLDYLNWLDDSVKE